MIIILSVGLSLVSSPPIVNALPKMDPGDPGICNDTGKKQGPLGAAVVKCCWHESVPPGTGGIGENLDKEEYCMECEDGGTRGYINCTDPELQYRDGGKPVPQLSDTINSGQISDDPEAGDDRNPSIPPTEGVNDGSENNDNSGSGSENADAQSNTIPRKGGSDLDNSTFNENVIVQ